MAAIPVGIRGGDGGARGEAGMAAIPGWNPGRGWRSAWGGCRVWERREGGRGAGDGEGVVCRRRSHRSGSFYIPSLFSTSFFLVVEISSQGHDSIA
jgi:hypothetical protein